MIISGEHWGWKLQTRLAVLLASSAIFLFLLNLGSELMITRRAVQRPSDQTVLKNIDEIVGRTLVQFGIEEHVIRTQNVQTPNNVFSRVERRAQVPQDFSVLLFNQSLGESTAAYNVSVIGTERTKERQTAIHLVWKERIVQTVVLISR